LTVVKLVNARFCALKEAGREAREFMKVDPGCSILKGGQSEP
jgi:hypothetical protein